MHAQVSDLSALPGVAVGQAVPVQADRAAVPVEQRVAHLQVRSQVRRAADAEADAGRPRARLVVAVAAAKRGGSRSALRGKSLSSRTLPLLAASKSLVAAARKSGSAKEPHLLTSLRRSM